MLSKILERTIIPLVLMTFIPSITLCFINIIVNYRSNIAVIFVNGPLSFLFKSWIHSGFGDCESWLLIFIFIIWGAVSMTLFGGNEFRGPKLFNGFSAEYRHNAFRYFVISTFIVTVALYFEFISAIPIYKKLVLLNGALSTFFILLSLFLIIKGNVAPSPGEYGISGNMIFDFYWGTELYPRLGRWLDIKLFCVSRFGMMAWLVLVLVTWKAHLDLRGFSLAMTATTILQIAYIGRHYWWEHGYCQTIDMFVDRAGWYLCYGAGGFMPIFYILNNAYQVENHTNLSVLEFIIILSFGIIVNIMTYWVDIQRMITRETNGKCNIWGKPAKIIHAKYLDHDGQEKSNVLLVSGFWGWVHHPNYVFEILTQLAMALPAKNYSIFPYLVTVFTTVLLVHRSFRDEKKCNKKYGKFWKEYCKTSKYRLIPYLF